MTSNKSSLFICRSPLQLLNCIEACEHFGLRDSHTVLVCAWRAERDRQLMQRLLDLYPHWSELYFFPLYPSKGQLPVMFKVFRGRRHFAHLFVGDTTHLINLFLNKIGRFDAIHMVDDGTATTHRARQISEKTLHLQRKNFSYHNPAVALLFARLGISSTFLYRAKLFTIYDIPHESLQSRIVRNQLKHCKSQLKEKPKTDEIWFIGSNIRREVLINPDDYDFFLDQVNQQINLSHVVYIPHRKEPDEYLEIISRRYDMKIRRLEDILEIELINAKTLPSAFISFGSSAIDTINMLIHPPITIFRIPDEAIKAIRLESVHGMYNGMSRAAIDIAQLKPSEITIKNGNRNHP